MDYLYKNNDHDVEWRGALARGQYLNSATVTYTLTGPGVSASGSVPYVADSNGDYLGTVESTDLTGVVVGETYTMTLTLVQGGFNGSRTKTYKGALLTQ